VSRWTRHLGRSRRWTARRMSLPLSVMLPIAMSHRTALCDNRSRPNITSSTFGRTRKFALERVSFVMTGRVMHPSMAISVPLAARCFSLLLNCRIGVMYIRFRDRAGVGTTVEQASARKTVYSGADVGSRCCLRLVRHYGCRAAACRVPRAGPGPVPGSLTTLESRGSDALVGCICSMRW